MEDDFHFVEPDVLVTSENEEDRDDDFASFSNSNKNNTKHSDLKSKNKNERKINNTDKIQKKRNDVKSNDNNDDLIAIKSIRAEINKELLSLRQEKKEITQLRNDLQNKSEQNEILNKELQSQLQSVNNLKKELEKELSSCSKVRTSVEMERTNLKLDHEKHQKDIKTINNEKLNEFETFYQKNENLYHKFNEYYNNINNMNNKINQELSSLVKLKQQQQEIINNCQQQLINIRKANVSELLPKLNKIEINNKIMDEKSNNNDINKQEGQEQLDTTLINNNNNNNNNLENITELEKSEAYACKKCGIHIAKETDIESRCYQVGQGAFNEKKRGYLFKNAYNLELKASKIENFTTGSYTIAWTNCIECNSQIGWKYLAADNSNNQNKVGKYCLSRYSLTSPAERNEF